LSPIKPVNRRSVPKPAKIIVGLREPAGASVDPAADAILSGSEPIVKVKPADVLESATRISLSPERTLADV